MKGSIIWRSGKPKKLGRIGTHITAITKRRFMPNSQRVKPQLPNGEVRYIRVSAAAIRRPRHQGAQAPWKKPEPEAKAAAAKLRIENEDGGWRKLFSFFFLRHSTFR